MFVAGAGLSGAIHGTVRADVYKCESDGRIVYGDVACASGRQSVVTIRSQATRPADRAEALERLRADKAAAGAMERERLARERIAPVSGRVVADRPKQVGTCAKLAVRAKRAHEDGEHAGPRDQWQKELRGRRADEDYAAACGKR